MNFIPAVYQPYIMIITLLILFITIYKEWVKPTTAFLFTTLALLILGILTTNQVIKGFANPSIASVVLLILITAGIRSNFNMEIFLDKAFGRSKTYQGFLSSMLTKVALLSSFINNTPVVVMMTPYVFNWGKKNGISPSRLLIPLSYATIIGGMITVVGTSTTLVLNGFLMEYQLPQISAMSLLIIGVLVAIVCLTFLIFFSSKLLPDKKDVIEKFEQNRREYLIEKRLGRNSRLIGKTVLEGGLRNLNGIYLVEIVRGEEIVSPVAPKEVIQEKDILIFAGNTDNIVDLTLSDVGVELPDKINAQGTIKVVEGVISANSSLIGKTIKASNFRERYDAAVIAIHRNGEKLSGKIGRIRIKAGDVLLMYTGKDFHTKVDMYKDLYVISGDGKEIDTGKNSSRQLLVVFGVTLALLASQLFSLFASLLIIFSLMVGMKLITLRNIKRDLDINLVAILVLSLAVGEAVISTGTGKLLADQVVHLLQPYGNVALLVGLMLITTVLTSFVSNVGAVAIAFPLAYAVSTNMGIDGAPLFLAIAFAASAAFLTPIGYQTNLIVYGPGGYTFRDFMKIGLPVTILYLTTVLIGIVTLYHKELL